MTYGASRLCVVEAVSFPSAEINHSAITHVRWWSTCNYPVRVEVAIVGKLVW